MRIVTCLKKCISNFEPQSRKAKYKAFVFAMVLTGILMPLHAVTCGFLLFTSFLRATFTKPGLKEHISDFVF